MVLYLIRLTGEIALKGRRRGYFENRLVYNIESLLNDLNVNYRIDKIDGGRILIYSSDDVSQDLQRVFGIVEILRVREGELQNLKAIGEMALNVYCSKIKGRSYAVRVRRVGSHEFTSLDVAREVGAKLAVCGGYVDLENPEIEIYIEIRDNRFFITSSKETFKGYGGLPLGVSEKVISLFSGGFDSTVASWMVMRKGSPTDFLHIALGSIDNVLATGKVAEKLARMWSIGYRPRLIIVDGAELAFEVRRKLPPHYWQIGLRRAMYEVASHLIDRYGAKAIVTGESIWEATSQTITNLNAAQKDLDVNIIRPVIGFDKDEIIDMSRMIGTYELNNRVKESCFLGSYPQPQVNIEKFIRYYSQIGSDTIDRAVDTAIDLDLYGDWVGNLRSWIDHSLIEVDTIPSNSIIVDVNRLHGSGVVKGLKDLEDLEKEKDKEIILVCEEGEASFTMARLLREKGFKAYSLHGGYRRLRELGVKID